MKEETKQEVLGYTLTDNQLTESTLYNEKTLYYSGFAFSISNAWATRPSVHTVHV
ncbi:hypothetical protein GCM10022292_11550 [Winogradskyella damuponensis]|uniref:Uncharacterized protein n=1 Tax=Winogradskyella damuponensis TaxID=943939 RepID=A0ABP8CQP0_9FLAO